MSSHAKQKILVIAPTVPRPDVNSGDLRLFTMLEILARHYAVYFISKNISPDQGPYVSLLERRGITVHTGPPSLRSLLRTERFSLAILEFYFTAEYFLERIRILQPDCPIVIDSVDVHFLRLRLKYELTGAEEDHLAWRETMKKELAVYRKADAVIAVTHDDAVALGAEGIATSCHVVPNIHKLCPSTVPYEPDSLIFVGGFAHTPNVDAVQYFCAEILPLIRVARPAVRFTIVGSYPPEPVRNLAGEHVTVTGFVPETSPYLHRSHVSVAPLRYGAGMKGKIGEAMAHGVPVVTTPVGAQGMGLAHGENALIAETPQQFAAAVLELLSKPDLHSRIRQAGLQLISEKYLPERVGESMLRAVEAIVAQPVKKMKISDKLIFFNGYFTSRVRDSLSPSQS